MAETLNPDARSAESAAERQASHDWLPGRNWGWIVARGALLILLGMLALLAPGVTVFAFTMVFAAFSLVDGLFAVAAGVRGARDRRERWGALLLSGMVGIAIGVVFVLFPLVSTLAFAITTVLLIAAWAIVTGALEIAAAIRMRKAIAGEWLLALSGALSMLLGLIVIYLAATTPGLTVLSVAWLIALYGFIAGIALVVLGLRLRGRAR